MKKLLILLFLGLSCSAFAQTVKVSGRVTGSDGTSLPGVYVMEENTTNATSTDLDGNFTPVPYTHLTLPTNYSVYISVDAVSLKKKPSDTICLHD